MSNITIGDSIPELKLPPVNRANLALYAGASGDHNPTHIDIDFARANGLPDVFAHGMLSMAWLGRLLTNWQPQSQLKQFSTKFSAITHIGDEITCTGVVTELKEINGEACAVLDIAASKTDGTKTLVGEALVAL